MQQQIGTILSSLWFFYVSYHSLSLVFSLYTPYPSHQPSAISEQCWIIAKNFIYHFPVWCNSAFSLIDLLQSWVFYPITQKSNVAKLNRYKWHRKEVECCNWRIIQFATINRNSIVHFYDYVMYPIFLCLSSSLFTPPTYHINLQLSPNNVVLLQKISFSIFLLDAIARSAKYIH